MDLIALSGMRADTALMSCPPVGITGTAMSCALQFWPDAIQARAAQNKGRKTICCL